MQFIANNWMLFAALIVVLYMLLGGLIKQYMYGVQHVSNPEAIRLINHEQALIVDVREPDEFRGGHLPKAVSLPLSALGNSLGQIEKYKSRPVIVYCRTNNRSARAAIALRKHEFANVQVLAGGVTGWQGENLPLEK